MILRFKVRLGVLSGGGRLGRQAASKAAVLLTPAALLALILACWRLGSDLGWTGEFAIHTGLFSHWQVWMAIAAALQVCASALNRYGAKGHGPAGTHVPPSSVRPAESAGLPEPRVMEMPDPALRKNAGAFPASRRRPPDTYPVKERTYF